jgi:hypothetical protein
VTSSTFCRNNAQAWCLSWHRACAAGGSVMMRSLGWRRPVSKQIPQSPVRPLPASVLDGCKDLGEYWHRHRTMPAQLMTRSIGPHLSLATTPNRPNWAPKNRVCGRTPGRQQCSGPIHHPVNRLFDDVRLVLLAVPGCHGACTACCSACISSRFGGLGRGNEMFPPCHGVPAEHVTSYSIIIL